MFRKTAHVAILVPVLVNICTVLARPTCTAGGLGHIDHVHISSTTKQRRWSWKNRIKIDWSMKNENPKLAFSMFNYKGADNSFSCELHNQNQSYQLDQSQRTQSIQWTNQKHDVITCTIQKARENAYERVTCSVVPLVRLVESRLVLVLPLIGWQSGASFFKPIA